MCLTVGRWSHSLLSCLTWRTKAVFQFVILLSLFLSIFISSHIFFKGLEFLGPWVDVASSLYGCLVHAGLRSPHPHLSHSLFVNCHSRAATHVPFDPTEQTNTWNSMDENIERVEANGDGSFHSKEPFPCLNRHASLLLRSLSHRCCCVKCVMHPVTIQTSGSQKQSSVLFLFMVVQYVLFCLMIFVKERCARLHHDAHVNFSYTAVFYNSLHFADMFITTWATILSHACF